jgi:hypothetical protein
MVPSLEEIWEDLGGIGRNWETSKENSNFKVAVTMDSFNHLPNQISHLKREDVLSWALFCFVHPNPILNSTFSSS